MLNIGTELTEGAGWKLDITKAFFLKPNRQSCLMTSRAKSRYKPGLMAIEKIEKVNFA